MKNISRRQFVKNSGSVVLLAALKGHFSLKKDTPLLSFSTLGCPDWSWENIVKFAAAHGYKGLEIRGIQREMFLPNSAVFSAGKIKDSLQMAHDNGLRIINLGSSATLHFSDAATRQKNMDEGKRFIDLAQQMQCPYIRVFPNAFPKEQDRNATMELIANGLHELGDYAKESNVTVLMETHGEVVQSNDIVRIMQMAAHPQVGLIWDPVNMWVVTKELPAQVYPKLKPYIRHAHIKDMKWADDKIAYTLLGEGIAPIFEAIDLLHKDNYTGFYSFEWEKLWHPEILEPEIALADYPKKIAAHFKAASAQS